MGWKFVVSKGWKNRVGTWNRNFERGESLSQDEVRWVVVGGQEEQDEGQQQHTQLKHYFFWSF